MFSRLADQVVLGAAHTYAGASVGNAEKGLFVDGSPLRAAPWDTVSTEWSGPHAIREAQALHALLDLGENAHWLRHPDGSATWVGGISPLLLNAPGVLSIVQHGKGYVVMRSRPTISVAGDANGPTSYSSEAAALSSLQAAEPMWVAPAPDLIEQHARRSIATVVLYALPGICGSRTAPSDLTKSIQQVLIPEQSALTGLEQATVGELGRLIKFAPTSWRMPMIDAGRRAFDVVLRHGLMFDAPYKPTPNIDEWLVEMIKLVAPRG